VCVLQCVTLRGSVLQCVTVCHSVSQCVAVCCSMIQSAAVCCCVYLSRPELRGYYCVPCSVWQRAAVCCSVLQSVAACILCGKKSESEKTCTRVAVSSQRVAVCCSFLHCAAVRCNVCSSWQGLEGNFCAYCRVLQCVAAYGSLLKCVAICILLSKNLEMTCLCVEV